MSTFDGLVREYPLVSIDRFTEQNYTSTTYFLSHCHTDHMVGLKDINFRQLLSERGFSKIYVSSVSKILLVNDRTFSYIAEYLEVIPLEQPTMISIPDCDGVEVMSVLVTLLPAGHCPGSVMFFIEGPNGNVLYTGDFRLEKGGAQRLPHLNYENGRVKPIKTLYLDTTFCDERALYFPTRQQSIDAVISLIRPWIRRTNRIIYFQCPAKFGYESIFVTLCETFKMKVHIDSNKYWQYKNIPGLEDSITVDAGSTQIHACYVSNFEVKTRENGRSPCGYSSADGQPVQLRVIRPCTMSFATNIKLNDIISVDKYAKLHRVCFPTHSSLTELYDIIRYTQPQAIHANVIPRGKIEEEVLHLLTPMIKPNTPSSLTSVSIPLLGELKALPAESNSIPSSCSLDFSYDMVPCQKIASQKENVSRTDQCNEEPCSTIGIMSGSWEDACLELNDSQNKSKSKNVSDINLDCRENEVENSSEKVPHWNETLAEKNEFDSIPAWNYMPPSSPSSFSSSSSTASPVSPLSDPESLALADASVFCENQNLPESKSEERISSSSSLSFTRTESKVQLNKAYFEKIQNSSSLSLSDSPHLVDVDGSCLPHRCENSQNGAVEFQNPCVGPEEISDVADRIPSKSLRNSRLSSSSQHLDMIIDVMNVDSITTGANMEIIEGSPHSDHNSSNTSTASIYNGFEMGSEPKEEEISFVHNDDESSNDSHGRLLSKDRYISQSVVTEFTENSFNMDSAPVSQNAANECNKLPVRTSSHLKKKKQRSEFTDVDDSMLANEIAKGSHTAAEINNKNEKSLILISSGSENEVSPTQREKKNMEQVQQKSTKRKSENHLVQSFANAQNNLAFVENFVPTKVSKNMELVQQNSHMENEHIPLITIDD